MEPIFRVRLGESYWPRHHFDDIYWSIVTIFQILTGENWNEVMYDAMRATSPIAALYFLFVLVCGNWVLLNLFLAILLDNFASEKSTADVSLCHHTHPPLLPYTHTSRLLWGSILGVVRCSTRGAPLQVPKTHTKDPSLLACPTNAPTP
jgi:hypothetical protein